MQHETSITLTEVALQQQQLEKARAYLPADLQVDTLPIFLQHKYWDVLSRIHANSGQWQAAYQTGLSAYQARFALQAAQQQQRLDQLAKGFKTATTNGHTIRTEQSAAILAVESAGGH